MEGHRIPAHRWDFHGSISNVVHYWFLIASTEKEGKWTIWWHQLYRIWRFVSVATYPRSLGIPPASKIYSGNSFVETPQSCGVDGEYATTRQHNICRSFECSIGRWIEGPTFGYWCQLLTEASGDSDFTMASHLEMEPKKNERAEDVGNETKPFPTYCAMVGH